MPKVSIILPPRTSHEDDDIRAFIAGLREAGKSNVEIRQAVDALPRIQPTKKEAEAEAAKGGDAFLDSLGIEVIGQHENGSIEVYSHRLRKGYMIRRLDRLSVAEMILFAGEIVETKVIDGPDSHGMKSIRSVRNMIAKAASVLPNITTTAKRGAGCWFSEASDSIYMVGDREISILNGKGTIEKTDKPRHEGQLYKLDGNPPWYSHDSFSATFDAIDVGQAVEDSVAMFARWRWQFSMAPQLVTGLIMATWVQTAWSWRPQVVMTGEKSTGKSIFFRTLKALFNQLACKTANNTTPAGLLKWISNSAGIVLVDELDTNKHRAEIIEMVRSSGRGDDERITGTPGAGYISTSLRQMFWMAGIESGLLTSTDAERFVRIEMLARKAGAAKIKEPSPLEASRLGQSLLAAAVKLAREATRLAESLSAEDFQGAETRVLETYAPAAAMYALASGHTPRGTLETFLANHDQASDAESDFDLLAAAIMGAHIRCPSPLGEKSASQLVEMVVSHQRLPSGIRDGDIAESSLEKCGIVIAGDKIRINQTDVARHLLQKTKYAKSKFSEILLREPGAENFRTRKRRFVEMDLDLFFDEEDEKSENDGF